MTSQTPTAISIVALGVYRHVAASLSHVFAGNVFQLAAILDLKSHPVAFQYSTHNLGAVLYNLEPRPKVFITGLAIAPEMTKEASKVFETYVKALEIEDSLLINLAAEDLVDGKWAEHIMGRLNMKYLVGSGNDSMEVPSSG